MSKRARRIATERTMARARPPLLNSHMSLDNRAQEDVSVTRTDGKETSNLLEVNSMEGFEEIALTMSRQHLLSFMPMPDSVAMQPF